MVLLLKSVYLSTRKHRGPWIQVLGGLIVFSKHKENAAAE